MTNIDTDGAPRWLLAFQAGRQDALEACYREYFSAVDRAVGSVLKGADRETVVHEVFYKLISNDKVRQSYQGGSMAGWLRRMARNHAIDFARRRGREVAHEEIDPPQALDVEASTDARNFVQAFAATVPEKWQAVFQVRFIEQLSQREAATKLDVSRTTLAYQETQIRKLLRRFARQGTP